MKKRWLIVLLIVLGWGSALSAGEINEWQMTQQAMVFKFLEQRETTLFKIRKAEETIAKANTLIDRARQLDNQVAESVALKALQTAQENKRSFEAKKQQIDRNIAYVRNRMQERAGSDTKIGGMVTNFSGRVRVISGKPPYEAVAMDGDHPGYFEEGDTIETYGGSRAEVQFLDGRGNMTIGEYSRVTMEQKNPLSETLTVAKGQIHASVDKAEAFGKWMENQAQMAADDPEQLLKHDFGAIRAWAKKKSNKFEVRTPSAVTSIRGTTFGISVDDNGRTVIELEEGALAVSNPKKGGETLLRGGEKATVGTEGEIRVEPLTLPSKTWWSQP
ncbi:FecR family protein [Sulfuricurvum sp.]|uniref:FecR family protein n=1 Tax=Sulfuricurvum sp. TaxID=2025608 RepID=UPI002E370EA8|nr:FecR family protein [Sulfuricurvum sp.]HEX5328735.1 FecR family protein [Sulfuricurvum sp.]